MSVTHDGTTIKSMTYDEQEVKTWIHDGVRVWSKAENTAITFSPTSMSKSGKHYPYDLNATIYRGIDLSLYKGIQFYVSSAYIDVDNKDQSTSIGVYAYNSNTGTSIGGVGIASNHRHDVDGEKVFSPTSQAGKTLTITFTENTGTGEIRVVGGGTCTCDDGNWALSNAILLAR